MRTVAMLVGVAVVGCGKKEGTGGPPPAPGPAPAAERAPTWGWHTYAADADGFKVTLPWEGKAVQRPVFGYTHRAVTGHTQYTAEQWEGTGIIKYSFSVVAARFRPNTAPAAREEATDQMVTPVVANTALKRSDPRPVTWAGQPATETVFEGEARPDGKKDRVVVRRLVTPAVGYLGVVRDTGGLTPADLATFFDSFQITSPAGPGRTGSKQQ
jgi:hypothetical protein